MVLPVIPFKLTHIWISRNSMKQMFSPLPEMYNYWWRTGSNNLLKQDLYYTLHTLGFLFTSPMLFHPNRKGPQWASMPPPLSTTSASGNRPRTSRMTVILPITTQRSSSPGTHGWKELLKKKKTSSKYHHIMLYFCLFVFFREDICRAKDKCDTLGKLPPFSLQKKYLHLESVSINFPLC